MSHLSTGLRNYLGSTGSLSAALNLVFVYLYDGPIPANADAAIDGGCTLLCKMAAGGGGATGGTWDAAVNGALPKDAGETWDGLIIGGGGTPTFARLCIGADDGSALSTTDRRWQMTAGGPGNEMVFTDPVFVDNGSNRKGLEVCQLVMPA